MRVAIVHDWLYVLGGAEQVLREILRCYPNADVFTLFDLLRPEQRRKLGFESSHTSFLQKMPFLRKHHRSYLPLMPLAIEQFDLSGYDLVISSSCAVAKGVLTGPEQLHIAYVHSPMRYAWDLQHVYLNESGYATGLKGIMARLLLHKMRIWDARTAHGPDAIFTNSQFVARRIKKTYGREAKVIYPPVSIANRDAILPVGNHFLAASRLVPYKRIEPIVRAFNELPDLELIVAGDGPEAEKLKAIARPNIKFVGFVPDRQLRDLMTTARAFVFAAEEDFGIVLIEAQSEGAPVLALGRGGARESILTNGARPTGMFFDAADPSSIAECVRTFLGKEKTISRLDCRQRAAVFSAERFRSQFVAAVNEELERFHAGDQRRAARLIA
ncbi:putative Glycosyl transferase, group 1 family protein [Bradyrhizobium sp. STM 3843]|uniref:glycosyltransferase n=1 Tax=Bradyrhizobium sp. STM 3843 TaxID=551947 RepID=UPI0002403112|nr:glycosyltransferase [Bradyrhizobium sp. STM 3843]CCE11269.1 putative Glycosyl transferase, group 1 family protein [Bradyrhizobium sp. STM 3843]